MSDIIVEVTKFREALVKANQKGILPISMSEFPRGCCGDSALLLGTYLKSIGFGDFDYVGGEKGCMADGDWCTHAWLEQGKLIIDVTRSQFEGETETVTVTEDGRWYDKFTVSQRFNANIEGTDDQLEPYLEGILDLM